MVSLSSALRRGSQDSSRPNLFAVGDAVDAAGKGFVSAVSRRRVPGREAVEGDEFG
jgi:thioredoxin reductase